MKFHNFQLFSVLIVILTLKSVLTSETEKSMRYDNFKVFKVKVNNLQQRELIQKLAEDRDSFNIWHERGNEIHLMVNPKELDYFQNLTYTRNLRADTFISNVQSLIDEEREANNLADSTTFGWTRYNTLTDIYSWLDEILAAYPDVTESIILGESYQKRSIRGIKISYKANNPGIFIESNIHAREWITSATATWFINELLTSDDVAVRNLAENYDWYIIPVFNVDGFVYSHDTDRLWRKSRQPSDSSACIGADINRNFDSHWMESNGASSNPCAENYAGPQPYSEPEASALANYISARKDRINILIAFHSYSQLLLSPYGHTGVEFPENYDELMDIAKAYADAVEALPYGTQYEYGSSAGLLYAATGATLDWAYNEADILVSYTIEFRDQGRYGFVLPPVQILPNCEETMQGMLALVAKAEELQYLELKYSTI